MRVRWQALSSRRPRQHAAHTYRHGRKGLLERLHTGRQRRYRRSLHQPRRQPAGQLGGASELRHRTVALLGIRRPFLRRPQSDVPARLQRLRRGRTVEHMAEAPLLHVQSEGHDARRRVRPEVRQMAAQPRLRVYLHEVSERTIQPRPHREHQRPHRRHGRLLQPQHLHRLAALGTGDRQPALPLADIQHRQQHRRAQQPLLCPTPRRGRLAYGAPRLPRTHHLSEGLGHIQQPVHQGVQEP